MNIVGHRKIFLTVSIVLVLAAAAAMILFGFQLGIDFRGGTLWSFHADQELAPVDVREAVSSALGSSEVQVGLTADGAALVRMPDISEDRHQELLTRMSERYPGLTELSFQSIGPSIGAALRNKAALALVLVLVGISLYIAFAFRKVYQPVSSWKYGFITLVTLFHDVIIPAGVMAVLGHYLAVEIDTNFLVALLVVMGFSVHDTIVVFDRIRENLLRERTKKSFEAIVNESVNQTLARSVNTSLTLILVLVALYAVGPEPLRYFVLVLLVGTVAGIYSSIFVASPLLTVWQGRSRRNLTK